eukprot:Polyplicarium_translucidae@DN3374_c1_g1_i15.p2
MDGTDGRLEDGRDGPDRKRTLRRIDFWRQWNSDEPVPYEIFVWVKIIGLRRPAGNALQSRSTSRTTAWREKTVVSAGTHHELRGRVTADTTPHEELLRRCARARVARQWTLMNHSHPLALNVRPQRGSGLLSLTSACIAGISHDSQSSR